MRIGVDGRVLTRTRTGIGRYLVNVLASLQEIDRENDYIVYVHRPCDLPATRRSNWEYRVVARPFPLSIGLLWLNVTVPGLLARDKVDVFWGPEQVLPLFGTGRTKLVVTIHDLVSYVCPETQTLANRVIGRSFVKYSVRKADAIVADSESTARDLRRFLGVERTPVRTVYLGADVALGRPGPAADLPPPLTAGQYVLFVGTFEPRKNITALLRAYAALPEAIRRRYPLVLAGAKGWKAGRLLDEIAAHGFAGQCIVMTQVTDALLATLYAQAAVFVFPSWYEGFGLPVLEALAAGCTVIASNASSLPEVGGTLAYYVDPGRADELSACLADVLTGKRPRVDRDLARAWAGRFSWSASAGAMLDVFRSVVDRPRNGERPA
jgi:glycosyltransferase involved in cell wall biosynthesis